MTKEQTKALAEQVQLAMDEMQIGRCLKEGVCEKHFDKAETILIDVRETLLGHGGNDV